MIRTACFLLLPVVVALLVPTVGALPAAVVGGVGAVVLHSWMHLGLHAALRRGSTENGQRARPVPWSDPIGAVEVMRREWDQRAEDVSFERIRGNLRLMGLAELWRAVSEDQPDEALFEGVLDFCRREVGAREVALLRLDPRGEELAGSWIRPQGDHARAHTVRWALAGLDGAIARALRTARTVQALEAPFDPLLRVNGETPRPAQHVGAHVVVPLVSPAPRAECLTQGWLHRDGCPAHNPHPDALARSRRRREAGALQLGGCGACSHYPVHGVLVITDAGRQSAPRAGEICLLESLAATVASVLEHAALYRDVKGGERFREQVLDAMINGLLSTDQHGRIVYANQRARDLVGGPSPVGRRLDEVLGLPGGSGALTRTLVEGKAHLQADGHVLADDGEGGIRRVPVRLNLTPFRPEDGGVHGAVCVVEDRSVVRAMEQEIRHLDTLAAIGRFASSLAHEVRNPLGGIQAGIEFLARDLARGGELDGDTRENMDVIEGEIRRLDGILRNLLSVARPREIVLEPCQPDVLVRRAVRSFAHLAETLGIDLRVRVAADLGEVHADPDMIHQVLVNLVKNALEASAAPSVVEVAVQGRRDPTGEEEVDGIVVEVLDRGPGFAEEDLPHLFEPFFSRKSNGTGLGLYVCHGFVQRHDGRLRAENRRGGGARFVLELPRVPALMGGLHEASHSRGR